MVTWSFHPQVTPVSSFCAQMARTLVRSHLTLGVLTEAVACSVDGQMYTKEPGVARWSLKMSIHRVCLLGS